MKRGKRPKGNVTSLKTGKFIRFVDCVYFSPWNFTHFQDGLKNCDVFLGSTEFYLAFGKSVCLCWWANSPGNLPHRNFGKACRFARKISNLGSGKFHLSKKSFRGGTKGPLEFLSVFRGRRKIYTDKIWPHSQVKSQLDRQG